MIISEILADIARATEYILFLIMFWNKSKRTVWAGKTVLEISIISIVQIGSYIANCEAIRIVLPIGIMAIMSVFGADKYKELGGLVFWTGIMEAYIATVFLGFMSGLCVGILVYGVSHLISFEIKLFITGVIRFLTVFIIWRKYEWLQNKSKSQAISVSIFIGSFVLFFQKLFQTAYSEMEYNFATILVLLLYLTMIFTAFMLLQHNRLTAKQQAMEEDNRQMSQRLHRSKDVLGVVSQVVASEDHIDPKLRQELADFCDDEMNEMQDRALGVNLIGDTGVELINVMLQRQMMRCAAENISFDVMIPAPIDEYIRDIGISVTEFMRMLNDLLKNAVKAILASENAHRELLLIMGEAGNGCLEIQIYDSGVPFPATILAHFGERGNTTDGTGNGIADTVATLGRYNASLALEVIEPGTDIYTKCIHIAFDGKDQMLLN